jgi:hypothetical protein
MGLFDRFRKKAQSQEVLVPDADESIRSMRETYRQCKTYLFMRFAERLTPKLGEERGPRVAGWASNAIVSRGVVYE